MADKLKELESLLDEVCGVKGAIPFDEPLYTISLTEVAEVISRLTLPAVEAAEIEVVAYLCEEQSSGKSYPVMADDASVWEVALGYSMMTVNQHVDIVQGILAGVNQQARSESAEDEWRALAMQFDKHRMHAMGLLKSVAAGVATAEDCAAFVALPPPAEYLQAGSGVPEGFVLADKNALRQVLQALVGAPHLIREIQVTRSPKELFADNPINVLIANYEAKP